MQAPSTLNVPSDELRGGRAGRESILQPKELPPPRMSQCLLTVCALGRNCRNMRKGFLLGKML